MFEKLFKKDDEIKSVSTSKYAPEIEQIHNEFNVAGETLLKEALAVLEDCKTKDLAKGELLASLGFTQTPQAKAVEEVKTKKVLAEQTAKLIHEYSFKYPNNKFITEDMVGEICKKYSLVCGDVSLYKGFVPKENLKEISKFKEKYKFNIWIGTGGIGDDKKLIFDAEEYEIKIEGGYYHFFHKKTKKKAFQMGVSEYKNRGFFRFYGYPDDNRRGEFHYNLVQQGLKICAPIKDMDTTKMQLDGYRLKDIPDPIVLQPVAGGYLVVSKWGDEASDELVVNERNN